MQLRCLGDQEKKSSADEEFSRWRVHEMGSSGEEEFSRCGVQEMESLGDGEFRI